MNVATRNNQFTNSANVTVNGSGTMNSFGASATIGSLTLNGGTVNGLAATGTTTTLGSNVVAVSASTPTGVVSSTISGNLAVGAAARTFTVNDAFVASQTATATVTPTSGGGTITSATATISGGAVTGITITGAQDFTSAPTITIAPPIMTATAKAVVTSGSVTSFNLTNRGGAGYVTGPSVTAPVVTITGGGDSGGSAHAVVDKRSGTASVSLTSTPPALPPGNPTLTVIYSAETGHAASTSTSVKNATTLSTRLTSKHGQFILTVLNNEQPVQQFTLEAPPTIRWRDVNADGIDDLGDQHQGGDETGGSRRVQRGRRHSACVTTRCRPGEADVQAMGHRSRRHSYSKRSRRQEGMLTFLAQDAETRGFCYANGELRKLKPAGTCRVVVLTAA